MSATEAGRKDSAPWGDSAGAGDAGDTEDDRQQIASWLMGGGTFPKMDANPPIDSEFYRYSDC